MISTCTNGAAEETLTHGGTGSAHINVESDLCYEWAHHERLTPHVMQTHRGAGSAHINVESDLCCEWAHHERLTPHIMQTHGRGASPLFGYFDGDAVGGKEVYPAVDFRFCGRGAVIILNLADLFRLADTEGVVGHQLGVTVGAFVLL